ncbi:hypothetical protein KS407_10070 [Bacillus alkalicola]|uniref:Uncharacterized protein n=1 Tax=Evansella alkalicola TaxID=745819 RepID=A0ABS6JT78_9BACI|nr:hypothetical protein [Bacillus alkalicola]
MLKMFIISVSILAFTACSLDPEGHHDSSQVNVMFLADVPPRYEDSFEPYFREILGDDLVGDLAFNTRISQVSHDMLTIAIVEREVDIFIVDEALMHVILDPYGLTPLDDLIDDLPDTPSYDEYIMQDEDTGKHHLYAIPLDNDSTLVQDMGLSFSSNLMAVVVQTSPHKEIGIKLLKEFI